MQTPLRSRPRRREAVELLGLLTAVGSTAFRQLLWHRAAELDLTFAQSQVLFHIARHPRCAMGDVARAYGVTLPAITHIVDRLEQKRFLVRQGDPVDRRVCMLALTRAGRVLVDDLQRLQLDALERVLARMEPADRRRVLRGLAALVAAASATMVTAVGHDGPAGGRRPRRNGDRPLSILGGRSAGPSSRLHGGARAGERIR